MLRRVMAGAALLLALGGLALLLESGEEAPGRRALGANDEGPSVTLREPPKVTFGPGSKPPGATSGPEASGVHATLGAESSQAAAGEEVAAVPALGAPGDLEEPIQGVVVDPDGAPIYMARIQELPKPNEGLASRRETTSDAQGRFFLGRVPPGGRIGVYARGFLGRVLPLAKKPAGVLKIELLPSKEISVLVVDAETGLPLENASVRVKAGSKHSERRTNKMGALNFTVGTESVSLEIWFKERVAQMWHDGDPPTIALERGRAVRGEVVLPGGVRAPVAPVIIIGRGQRRWPQKTKTDGDGHFELPGGIAPGEQFAVFSWDQANATPLKYDWFPAGSDGVLVQMESRGGVEVFGGGGPEDTPLRPTATLPVSANRVRYRPWTGHATYTLLAPGTYQMRSPEGTAYGERFKVEPRLVTRVEWKAKPGQRREARPPRRGHPASASDAAEGEARAGEPTAAPTVTLEAKVEPHQPVEVRVRRSKRTVRYLRSSKEGAFRLTNLPPGDYTLEIKRRDGQTFLLDVTLPLDDLLTIPIADQD